jgi:hypothetical protein
VCVLQHNTCSVEVVRGADKPVAVIAELPEATIAVEAEDAAHFPGSMIVVDVFGIRPTADCTDTALLSDEIVELVRTDAISTFQVVVTTAAVQSIARFLAAGVVADLAIRVATIPHPSIAREPIRRFPLPAVGATLHGCSVRAG